MTGIRFGSGPRVDSYLQRWASQIKRTGIVTEENFQEVWQVGMYPESITKYSGAVISATLLIMD
jgi:hypothetical protein